MNNEAMRICTIISEMLDSLERLHLCRAEDKKSEYIRVRTVVFQNFSEFYEAYVVNLPNKKRSPSTAPTLNPQ